MNATLGAMAAIFGQLSLLAFGGGNTILPEMQRAVVDVHHWMSAQEFSALFALAQAAPGPNMMIVSLIGWHVASWAGLLVTTAATFGPSSAVTASAIYVWERCKERPWLAYVRRGMVPVTAGLVAASAALICEASDHAVLQWGITAASAALAFRTRVHPLWLLGGGALAGWAGGFI